jgi:hypothetical protein
MAVARHATVASTLASARPFLSPNVLVRPLGTVRLLAGLTIIFLNLVDAFATLCNVSRGAEELNPLMAILLAAGEREFVVVKHLLASLGVVGILAHPTARASRLALGVLLPLYVGIAVYQLALLVFIR